MRKIFWVVAAALSLGTVAWVQVNQPGPAPLSSLMPAGPMIYLEATDFHSLLTEWNQSQAKRAWLGSANYRVFANSNLFQKLGGLYQEYGGVAGFLPGLSGTIEIAGRESALGLYDFREQQFVYITRLEESQLEKSQLWRLRQKFTTLQASGISFYLKRDDASNRTVAFTFTGGWLIVATRDDLMASTLALIARQNASSLAAELWYASASQQAGPAGELRMGLNMQALIGDVHFRSYWIQRNVSELRPFSGEIVDIRRTQQEVDEDRTLVRMAEQQRALPGGIAINAVAALRAIAPPDAALSRTWAAPTPAMAESMIQTKLLKPAMASSSTRLYAPEAISTDESAGSEQDLEMRIDEPPLADDVAGKLNVGALSALISRASPDALIEIQSTGMTNSFVQTPCVIVLSAASNWDVAGLREALTSAVESLWSTSRLGVEWRQTTLGQHAVEELNGLATLLFALDGSRLYLANDPVLLLATLNRSGEAPVEPGPAYAAELNHGSERADYLTIMSALDFGRRQQFFLFTPQGNRTPQFFSENLASLSSVFDFVRHISVTQVELQQLERQRVAYR